MPLFTNLIRSLLAGLFILLAYALTNLWQSGLLIAAVGASTYIVFLLPESQPAGTRSILGGYACGAAAGVLCGLLQSQLGGETAVVFCALAVFLTSFAMKQLKAGHPPAAAMTISVTLANQPLAMAAVALVTACALLGGKLLAQWLVRRIEMQVQPFKHQTTPSTTTTPQEKIVQ